MGWEVGGWAGVANYFGDLNTRFNVAHPGVAGGGIARYNFNNRISLRFGANYANIGADDARSKNSFEKQRNLSFNSHVFEGFMGGEFNFLPYTHGDYEEFFTPYVLAGFNVFHFNPRTQYEGEWVALNPLGTEGQFKGDEYYLTTVGLVYGVGMKVDLTSTLSLNFELTSRYLFTDYLDDVSTVYADKDDLESQRGELAVILSDRSFTGVDGVQIGQPGRQRGDSSNKDTWATFGVGLVYYFGDVRCPKWR